MDGLEQIDRLPSLERPRFVRRYENHPYVPAGTNASVRAERYLVSSDFCDLCRSDEEVSYCSAHKKFLSLKCDWELHSVEIKRAYELYSKQLTGWWEVLAKVKHLRWRQVLYLCKRVGPLDNSRYQLRITSSKWAILSLYFQ